jgi:hypothetical protein
MAFLAFLIHEFMQLLNRDVMGILLWGAQELAVFINE